MDNSPSTSQTNGLLQSTGGLSFAGSLMGPFDANSPPPLTDQFCHNGGNVTGGQGMSMLANNCLPTQQQQQTMDVNQMMSGQQVANNPGAEPFVCAGCGGKIVDRFMLKALDKLWHEDCLKVENEFFS